MVGMEAAALSAAITGILKVVGNKLAPLVIKEYSSIVGVKKDLQELQDLVQEINCRLGIAGDRAIEDAPWLKKLKQVAYDVDDVVDEFQLKAEKHDADGGGGSVSRFLHTKTESFLLQCKAAKKIKQINKRFAEIVKQRTDLTAIFGHDPVSHINKTAVNMQILPVGDEATILGRDQEMRQIISNLVDNNEKTEIKIVSIVGLGGSGKTAVAKLIFNEGETIEKQFEVRLWVHVSQEFDFEKLIKKLFEAFADKDPGQHSLPYMSKRIQEGLTRKKFLIVMDDIWTESQNQWDKIMGHLKAGAPGSGILLTTHSKHVAKAVRSTYQFCLPRLSSDDSWRLEALHITHSGFLGLPQSIGKLQKLRTLNLSWCIELKILPDSIGDCHMISSIDLSFCYELTSLPISINRNENLRVLRLRNTRIERLTTSITTLINLEYLDLSCSCLIELPEGIENLRKLKVRVMNLEGCLKLRSMPKGIHQLVHLQKLGLFALGEGVKCAQLSELANVCKLGGDLTVTGIEQMTEPSDARMACLKQKTNLQQLSLVWRSGCMDVGNEFAVSVLNGLEPPSEIKGLKIKQYTGRQYTEWMQKQDGESIHGLSRFPFLTRMTLSNFPKLKHLEGLVELPCLKDIELIKMLALESISGGPFPSLVYFNMIGLPRLKEVWMVTQQTSKCTESGGSNNQTSGQVQIGICLAKLSIDRCPALVVKPHLPLSLEDLQLSHTNEQLVRLPGQQDQQFKSDTGFTPSIFSFSCLKNLRLRDVKGATSPVLKKKGTASSSPRSVSLYSWKLIQHMRALEDLKIECWAGLIELPESIRGLTSLLSLNIQDCSCLCTLPEWLGAIRSLECMVIQNCNSLSSLPTSFQQLTTLQCLVVVGCSSLKLPEWLGELRSLKYLWAHCCWDTIPKSLGQLNSLELLRIEGCDERHQPWGHLKVCPCDAHHQLPEFMLELHSLRELYIGKLRGLTCLPQSMGFLTSLESLTLESLHALGQLPECLVGICSLRKLYLKHLHGLTSLPQSMCCLTSLEELYCRNCQGMRSFPEGILRPHGSTIFVDRFLPLSGEALQGRRFASHLSH